VSTPAPRDGSKKMINVFNAIPFVPNVLLTLVFVNKATIRMTTDTVLLTAQKVPSVERVNVSHVVIRTVLSAHLMISRSATSVLNGVIYGTLNVTTNAQMDIEVKMVNVLNAQITVSNAIRISVMNVTRDSGSSKVLRTAYPVKSLI